MKSHDDIYDIFLSYRRKGGFETAKHLFDLLTRDGYRVSFDIDPLRSGDFNTELLRRIDRCTDFILILNKGAFDRSTDLAFDRNRDWLRIELAYALEKGKNIIPVMLSGFTEFPDNLPADIAAIARKNGLKYNRDYFDAFYNKLLRFFDCKPASPAQSAEQKEDPDAAAVKIETDLACRIFVDGEERGMRNRARSPVFPCGAVVTICDSRVWKIPSIVSRIENSVSQRIPRSGTPSLYFLSDREEKQRKKHGNNIYSNCPTINSQRVWKTINMDS